MAKCKNCKINIYEGTEYCKDCEAKMKLKGNESYLDSLLNSVKNSPTADQIYKKKTNINEKSNPATNSIPNLNRMDISEVSARRKDPVVFPDMEEDDLYRVDFSDIEDFSKFNFEEDLGEIESDIIIKDEDLFGTNLSELLETDQEEIDEISIESEIEKAIQEEYDTASYPEEAQDRMDRATAASTVMESDDVEKQDPVMMKQFEAETEVMNQTKAETEVTKQPDDFNFDNLSILDDHGLQEQIQPEPEKQVEINQDQSMNNLSQDEYSDLSSDTDIDLDLDDLLNSLDSQSLEEAVTNNMDEPEDIFNTFGNENEEEMLTGSMNSEKDKKLEFEQVEADHDDFLSLLGQISEEDPASEDIRAISDMLVNGSTSFIDKSMPSDVGEVFSDALKAVSSLNDYELEEDEILKKVSEQTEKKGKSGKKAKKEKQKKEGKDKSKKEKSGLSLFQRLFGNVKNDKTVAEHEEELRKQTEPKAEKVKKAKGKNKKWAEPTEEDEENLGGKADSKNKAAKKEGKKEKAEKKRKTKEVIQVIDEIDEDPGRINRLGAVIVFFFFAIIATILIIGSNMVTYTLSIQHATNYFNHRKYTQAYNEVYGVDIKDEDIEMYDKIQTVMFVNKQLNSYNNYYAIEKYPEALDSLLKGLSRYDKYIELATMLGIESDLDYVRSQILAELSNVFNLSEEKAMQILEYDSMEDYSLAVYDVVLEKMNN